MLVLFIKCGECCGLLFCGKINGVIMIRGRIPVLTGSRSVLMIWVGR